VRADTERQYRAGVYLQRAFDSAMSSYTTAHGLFSGGGMKTYWSPTAMSVKSRWKRSFHLSTR
jgi:hypothetical protein